MAVHNLLANTVYKNSESEDIAVHAIRVHETATGYAECQYGDISIKDWEGFKDLNFSHVNPDNAILKVMNNQATYSNPEEIKG